jgi:hypothetical protein
MSRQTWTENLAAAVADGTPIANTVTETVIFPDVTIPKNYLQDGRTLHGKVNGKLSTTGTPTVKFGIRLGGVAGTLIGETELLTNGSAVANVNWELEFTIQTRVNGSGGKVICFGSIHLHTAAGTVVQNIFSVSGFDAPAEVTVNLTLDQGLAVTATWGTASVSNTLTGMVYVLNSLN